MTNLVGYAQKKDSLLLFRLDLSALKDCPTFKSIDGGDWVIFSSTIDGIKQVIEGKRNFASVCDRDMDISEEVNK